MIYGQGRLWQPICFRLAERKKWARLFRETCLLESVKCNMRTTGRSRFGDVAAGMGQAFLGRQLISKSEIENQ
jgi:hypothetical protein